VVAHIAEARADGIVVLPPDVNDSDLAFGVAPNPKAEPKAESKPKRGQRSHASLIRFGLGAIKGVGENSIGSVLSARGEPLLDPSAPQQLGAKAVKKPFRGLFDFCARIDGKKLNRKTVEALVAAGAFDFTGKPRLALFDAIEPALAQGAAAQKDRDSGQFGLFAAPRKAAGAEAPAVEERVTGKEEWPERLRLAKEKEALGFYITGHPLARYEADVKRFATHTCASLANAKGFEKVAVGGIVTGYRERITKTGKKIGFAVLEDLTGGRELIVYDEPLQRFGELLQGDEPVLVRGMVRFAEKFGQDAAAQSNEEQAPPAPEIKVDDVQRLADVREQHSSKVEVRVQAESATPERLGELKALFGKHPGGCSALLTIVLPKTAEARIAIKGMKVSPDDDLLAAVDRLFGEKVASVR
jgi:DNA polymerase-3 subunit alpha